MFLKFHRSYILLEQYFIKKFRLCRYTLLVDGTRNKSNAENVSVCIRYVKNGIPCESLLAVPFTPNDYLDAKSMTDLIMDTLEQCGLDPKHMISQCYDGASVMRGHKGGVQALIQERLAQIIPYVHCFNHRLHLVIIHAIEHVQELSQYFDQCAMLYEFFRRPKVSCLYEGTTLKRLLPQRWSGHFQTTLAVSDNYQEIVNVLDDIANNRGMPGDCVAEAIGLSVIVKRPLFRMCLCIVQKILSLLTPVDKLLQLRSSDLKQAMLVIDATMSQIAELRSGDAWEKCVKAASLMLPQEDMEETPIKCV